MSALTGKRVNGDDDSDIKEHLYSAITCLILKIFPFSVPTITTFNLP